MTIEPQQLEPGTDIANTSVLHDVVLPGVDLTDALAANVDAIGAELPAAKFTRADLRGAFLCHCDLTSVDFTNADLTDANLHGAALAGAVWTGAVLDRVCWHDAVNVPKEAADFDPWVPTIGQEVP